MQVARRWVNSCQPLSSLHATSVVPCHSTNRILLSVHELGLSRRLHNLLFCFRKVLGDHVVTVDMLLHGRFMHSATCICRGMPQTNRIRKVWYLYHQSESGWRQRTDRKVFRPRPQIYWEGWFPCIFDRRCEVSALEPLFVEIHCVSVAMFGLRARTVKLPAAAVVSPTRPAIRAPTVLVSAEDERWRLDNLGPAPGSRKRKTRKGRGHAAGQVRLRHRPQRVLLFPSRYEAFLSLLIFTAGISWLVSSALHSRDVGC